MSLKEKNDFDNFLYLHVKMWELVLFKNVKLLFYYVINMILLVNKTVSFTVITLIAVIIETGSPPATCGIMWIFSAVLGKEDSNSDSVVDGDIPKYILIKSELFESALVSTSILLQLFVFGILGCIIHTVGKMQLIRDIKNRGL